MKRIESTLAALKSADRTALIPYITAGDPHPSHTVGLMHALVEGGADIIELGVPFSDPMADGPVIQLACERALIHHTSLWMCCDLVAEFRKTDSRTPAPCAGVKTAQPGRAALAATVAASRTKPPPFPGSL